MFKLKDNKFINRIYLPAGIISCVIPIISLISIIFFKMGILRVEYNVFFFVILPNFIAKFFLMIWALRYSVTKAYGRDVNDFAKSLIGLAFVNMIIIAMDETTKFYYLAQSFTAAIYSVFMCVLVYQRKHAIRAKKYASAGFGISVVLYLTVALQVFSVAISLMDGYDPYQLAVIIIFYLVSIFNMIGVSYMEKKYIIIMKEASSGN